MTREPADVTATEMAILDVLWREGATTVRDVVESIYGQHRQSLHATVKSLLERLTEKGYVRCEKRGFAHLFRATVGRDAFVAQQLQRLADNHYDGELTPMLLTLIDRVQLSRKDREAIRKIIDNIRD